MRTLLTVMGVIAMIAILAMFGAGSYVLWRMGPLPFRALPNSHQGRYRITELNGPFPDLFLSGVGCRHAQTQKRGKRFL